MTKKIKQYSLMLLLLTVFSGKLFGQENARVVAIFNLGIVEYAYLFDESNQLYLKSTAFQSGSITEGQDVELIPFTTNSDPKIEKQLKIDGQNLAIYAELLLNDNFSLPASAAFGMPWVERDVLFFSSKEHLAEFIGILTDFSDSRFEEFYFLMNCFERQFPNYKSFNRMMHENYNYFYGEIDDITHDEINSVDYFRDDIFKTVVNEFGEIGIGDSVHVMKKIDDHCYTILFNKNDFNNYEKIRMLSTSDFEAQLISIQSENRSFIDGKEENLPKVTHTTDVGDAKLIYRSNFKVKVVNCTMDQVKLECYFQRLFTSNDLNLLNLNQFSAVATINWGDNTTSTYTLNNPSLINIPVLDWYVGSTSFSLSHTYLTTNNTYNIIMNIVVTSEEISTTPTIFALNSNKDFSLPSAVCTKESYFEEHIDDISSTKRMISEGYVNNYLAWHSIGAKTTYEEFNGSGWKKEKADLGVEIHGVFRKHDCSVGEQKDDSKYRNNRKDISVSVQKYFRFWAIGNDDCYSKHKVTKNGVTVTRTIYFHPC